MIPLFFRLNNRGKPLERFAIFCIKVFCLLLGALKNQLFFKVFQNVSFGSHLGPLMSLWALFWPTFGSLWVPFGPFWSPTWLRYTSRYRPHGTQMASGCPQMSPRSPTDASRCPPDAPSYPQMLPDVPRCCPDAPQIPPDVPQMPPDVPRCRPDAPQMPPDMPRCLCRCPSGLKMDQHGGPNGLTGPASGCWTCIGVIVFCVFSVF